jgi:chromosome segregation ATPase
LPELKRKYEITHLVVFGYFACDLELGSVEILSQRDDFEMKLKESMENSELLRRELMEVKEKSEQLLQKSELTEHDLKEVKIKGERLQNELIAAKMKLKLKCQEAEKERDMFKDSTVQLAKEKNELERQVVSVKGSLRKNHLETIEEFRKSFEKLASSIPGLSQVEEAILSASERLSEDLSAKKEKLAKQLSSSKEELSTLKSVCAELEGISSPTEEQKRTFYERKRDLESLESTVSSLQLEYDNALLKLTWCEEGVLKELKLKEEIQYKSTKKTEEIEAVVSALKNKGKKLEEDEYFRGVMEREKREALLKEEVQELKVDLEDVQHTKEELLKELEGTKSQLQVAMEINKTLEAKPKVCGCTREHVFM